MNLVIEILLYAFYGLIAFGFFWMIINVKKIWKT